MQLLLDTHTVLWWFLGDAALSPIARAAVADSDNESFVSAASAWEIATKYRTGKLPRAAFLATDFTAITVSQGFAELPISIRHGQLAGSLPGIHKDPFDRMLIAQAMTAGMTLVSNDAIFRKYDVTLLW
jgi:PIN domain nuclease of toxin-antitoxin system